MKRVRPGIDAYDSPTDGSPADVRLTEILNAWAIWMHAGTYGRGYPRKSPGMRGYGSNDIDASLREGDKRIVEAVDAAIDGLPHNERIAILRLYALTADVWRLREPWPVLEERARQLIRISLNARKVE